MKILCLVKYFKYSACWGEAAGAGEGEQREAGREGKEGVDGEIQIQMQTYIQTHKHIQLQIQIQIQQREDGRKGELRWWNPFKLFFINFCFKIGMNTTTKKAGWEGKKSFDGKIP